MKKVPRSLRQRTNISLDPALFQKDPKFVPLDAGQLKRDVEASAQAKEAALNTAKVKKGQLPPEDSRRRSSRQDLRKALEDIRDDKQNTEELADIDIESFVAAWENKLWDITGGDVEEYEEKVLDAGADLDNWYDIWEGADDSWERGASGHGFFWQFYYTFGRYFTKEGDQSQEDDVDAEGDTDDEDYTFAGNSENSEEYTPKTDVEGAADDDNIGSAIDQARADLTTSIQLLLDRFVDGEEVPDLSAILIADVLEWKVYNSGYKPDNNMLEYRRQLQERLTELDDMGRNWSTPGEDYLTGQDEFCFLAQDCDQQRDQFRHNGRQSIKWHLDEVLTMLPATSVICLDDVDRVVMRWEDEIWFANDDVAIYHATLEDVERDFKRWMQSWDYDLHNGRTGKDLFEKTLHKIVGDSFRSSGDTVSPDHNAASVTDSVDGATFSHQDNGHFDDSQLYGTEDDTLVNHGREQDVKSQESSAALPLSEQFSGDNPILVDENYIVTPDSAPHNKFGGSLPQVAAGNEGFGFTLASFPIEQRPIDRLPVDFPQNTVDPSLKFPSMLPGLTFAAATTDAASPSQERLSATSTAAQHSQDIDDDDEMDICDDGELYGSTNTPKLPPKSEILAQQATSSVEHATAPTIHDDVDMNDDVSHLEGDQFVFDPVNIEESTKAATTEPVVSNSDSELDDLAAAIMFEIEKTDASPPNEVESTSNPVVKPYETPQAKEPEPRLFAGFNFDLYKTADQKTTNTDQHTPRQKVVIDFGVSTSDLSQLMREPDKPQAAPQTSSFLFQTTEARHVVPADAVVAAETEATGLTKPVSEQPEQVALSEETQEKIFPDQKTLSNFSFNFDNLALPAMPKNFGFDASKWQVKELPSFSWSVPKTVQHNAVSPDTASEPLTKAHVAAAVPMTHEEFASASSANSEDDQVAAQNMPKPDEISVVEGDLNVPFLLQSANDELDNAPASEQAQESQVDPVEDLQSELSVSQDDKTSPETHSQDSQSTPPSSSVEDNVTATIDYLPALQAPQAVMATPEQIDRILQNHDAKHRELLAKMDSLKNIIASMQQSGDLQEQQEVEAVASEIETKVAEFGQFSERDIKEQLAHVSGMATEPDEKQQPAEVVADKAGTESVSQDITPPSDDVSDKQDGMTVVADGEDISSGPSGSEHIPLQKNNPELEPNVVEIAPNHVINSDCDKPAQPTGGLSDQNHIENTKNCDFDMVKDQLTQSAKLVSSDENAIRADATDKPESKAKLPNVRILRRTEYSSYAPAKKTKKAQKAQEAREFADIAGVNGKVRQQYAIRKRNEAAYAIAEKTLQEKKGVESKSIKRVEESPEIVIKRTEKSPEIVELSLVIEMYNQGWLDGPVGDLPPPVRNIGQALFNSYTNIDQQDEASALTQLNRLLKKWQLLFNMIQPYLDLRSSFDNTAEQEMRNHASKLRACRISTSYLKLAAQCRDQNNEFGARRYDDMAAKALQKKEELLDFTQRALDGMVENYHAYYQTAREMWNTSDFFFVASPGLSLHQLLEITLKEYSMRIKDAHAYFDVPFTELSTDVSTSEYSKSPFFDRH
jgi:hypothetical protein